MLTLCKACSPGHAVPLQSYGDPLQTGSARGQQGRLRPPRGTPRPSPCPQVTGVGRFSAHPGASAHPASSAAGSRACRSGSSAGSPRCSRILFAVAFSVIAESRRSHPLQLAQARMLTAHVRRKSFAQATRGAVAGRSPPKISGSVIAASPAASLGPGCDLWALCPEVRGGRTSYQNRG